MGVATGCGCKEVYRFPHTYPYSSCICSFLQQHPIPTFSSFFLNVLYMTSSCEQSECSSAFNGPEFSYIYVILEIFGSKYFRRSTQQ